MTSVEDEEQKARVARALKFLNRTFQDAEDHLKLKRGTLADTRQDTHFTAIMKMASTIEPLVNEVLREEIKGNFRKLKVEHEGATALAAFVTKTTDRERKQRLARELGIIDDGRSAFISAVYQVRDRYAHNVQNMHLSIAAIAEKIQESGGTSVEKILLELSGLDKSKHSPLALVLGLKLGMYYQFARFLADVLNVLKPPSPFAQLTDILAKIDEKNKAVSPENPEPA